jgi:hypothetical protein
MPINDPIPLDDYLNNPLLVIDYDYVDEMSKFCYIVRKFISPDIFQRFKEDPKSAAVPAVVWGYPAKEVLTRTRQILGNDIKIYAEGIVNDLIEDERLADEVAKRKNATKSDISGISDLLQRLTGTLGKPAIPFEGTPQPLPQDIAKPPKTRKPRKRKPKENTDGE